MEPETSDSGSMASAAYAASRGVAGSATHSTRAPGLNAAVRPLPAVRDNVKKVMFYC
ncbi:hypothetical protein Lalb_Chr22g0353831 [Lupinus albus]|uniref:Uncharacterized protein n=1 Tax=Lupinus albus TaxID=3870 RepID=A0A6A4N819_LUPAL|nr:hypothetical protein Lalb_Chr22g0353831 [Lupinus albus]